MSMTVKVKFAATSPFGPTAETFRGVTEIHYLYPSALGDKRVAFESDIQGTGWVYDVADIAEFEALTELVEIAQ